MTATTHVQFNEKTEGLEVAQAFSGEIHGKTILVTGVNPAGIGFTTAEAFVGLFFISCFVISKSDFNNAS
jgi:hypothetical protein